jgi:tetratricopeptide (TPR) repeat protein
MEHKTISLSQISIFNPQSMSDIDVENLFVARVKLFNFIIETQDSIAQHYLVIAQRGMGKSTLLKRIEVELRKDDLKNKFVPLLFPEEQYNIGSLADFWMNSLDCLADTLDVQNEKEKVKLVDLKIAEINRLKSKEDISKEAYNFLIEFTCNYQCRPVLLIDNISLIFHRLNKSDQHTLRAWLMKNGAPIIIGASATAIEDTFNYGAPFYDAFQFQYLSKLSFDELIEILSNLSRMTNTPEVMDSVREHKARLKTICQLTGGNPRTANLLYRLILKGFSKEITQDLEGILDEITPLYKARFEELSTQNQIIVDAIALHWDPINIEQLRLKTSMKNNQLSPVLNRLIDVGWIEKVETYITKGSYYQISERFFNIWFIMRRSTRRQKKELYCLSKFLETMYGDELDDYAKRRLVSRSHNSNDIAYNLAIADTLKNNTLSKSLREKSIADLKELTKNQPEIIDNFDLAELLDEGNPENLEKKLMAELKDNPKSAQSWNDLGNLYQDHLKKYIEAENAYTKAISFDKNYSHAWYNLGNLFQFYLKKYDLAENAYKNAIRIDENDPYSWNNLGNLYQIHLRKYHEAENAYRKTIAIREDFAPAWNNLGHLYQFHLRKYNEAENAYIRAIMFDENYTPAWKNLGHLYQIMNKFTEAVNAYKKSIDLDENDSNPWYNLGYLYQIHLKKYNEAENAYNKAISINENDPNPWNSLGNLYQDHLKKYTEAEDAYKKAIELDPEFYHPKYNLVFLYRDKINKIKEAEEVFNTIKLTEELADSYYLNEALFELYKKNEGLASEFLNKALDFVMEGLPPNTQDDWWRFAKIVIKLGYSNWFLEIMEGKGFDVILSPYFTAIKATTYVDRQGYLNTKAVEIREAALHLIEIFEAE